MSHWRWWIAGGAVVLAAGGVAGWVFTRSERPTEYATMKAGVIAACHADPTRSPYRFRPPPPTAITGRDYPQLVYATSGWIRWMDYGSTVPHQALFDRMSDGRFVLKSCDVRHESKPIPVQVLR